MNGKEGQEKFCWSTKALKYVNRIKKQLNRKPKKLWEERKNGTE